MLTATDLEFADVEVVPTLAVQITSQCAPDPASIGAAMDAAFGSLMKFIGRHGLTPSGPPRAIYTVYGSEGVTIIAAMPILTSPSAGWDDPRIQVETLNPGRAYRFTHHGHYSKLGETYNRITAFMKDKGWLGPEGDLCRFMPMWEEYVTDPSRTRPEDLLTYIYLPAA